jgi:hypothetical protein
MIEKTLFIEQREPEALEEIRQSKIERKLKNQNINQVDRERARNIAHADWIKYQWDYRVKAQSPDDWLTNDPIWNPKHPLYKTVNALIESGVPAPDAVKQAEESEIVVVPAYVASEKQTNFVSNLLDEREAPTGLKVVSVDDFSDVVYQGRTQPTKVVVQDEKILGKREASQLIDTLLKAPRKQRESNDSATVAGLDLTDLPNGYYAVPDGDTRLKIKVEHGKPNTRWEGWTFVKDGSAYGNANRYGMQKPGQPYKGKIEDQLATVLENPAAAVQAYGALTGKCAVCNRKLEDERSVELGIGPICESKSPLF